MPEEVRDIKDLPNFKDGEHELHGLIRAERERAEEVRPLDEARLEAARTGWFMAERTPTHERWVRGDDTQGMSITVKITDAIRAEQAAEVSRMREALVHIMDATRWRQEDPGHEGAFLIAEQALASLQHQEEPHG